MKTPKDLANELRLRLQQINELTKDLNNQNCEVAIDDVGLGRIGNKNIINNCFAVTIKEVI